jgi:hypothetical protein
MTPAWFSPRYMAFWILILFAWLLCEMWMPELREHKVRVTLLMFIAAVFVLVGLK